MILNIYTWLWVRRMSRKLMYSDQSWDHLISSKRAAAKTGKPKLGLSLGMQDSSCKGRNRLQEHSGMEEHQ